MLADGEDSTTLEYLVLLWRQGYWRFVKTEGKTVGTLPKIFPHKILKNVPHRNLIFEYMIEYWLKCKYFAK